MPLFWQRWLLWLRKASAWRASFGTEWVEPSNVLTLAAFSGPIELPLLPWYSLEDFEDSVPTAAIAPQHRETSASAAAKAPRAVAHAAA